jgi:hypothetical protein
MRRTLPNIVFARTIVLAAVDVTWDLRGKTARGSE